MLCGFHIGVPLSFHLPAHRLFGAGLVTSSTPLNTWPSWTSQGYRTRGRSVHESFYHIMIDATQYNRVPLNQELKDKKRTCVLSHSRKYVPCSTIALGKMIWPKTGLTPWSIRVLGWFLVCLSWAKGVVNNLEIAKSLLLHQFAECKLLSQLELIFFPSVFILARENNHCWVSCCIKHLKLIYSLNFHNDLQRLSLFKMKNMRPSEV